MSKLWIVQVKREIEEPYSFHIRQDEKPTEAQVIKELSDNHYINDDPEYTEYEISEVTV